MYKIVVMWAHGGYEIVDEFDTEEEARTMAAEYRMCYGAAAVSVGVTEVRTAERVGEPRP